jgi:hypothetical protein
VIEVNVMTSGLYFISTDSDIDVYGYIYKHHFNPLNQAENLLFEDDDGCEDKQFKFAANLQSGVTYGLVTTTFAPEKTGNFMIFASGLSNVNFSPISEYSHTFQTVNVETQKNLI